MKDMGTSLACRLLSAVHVDALCPARWVPTCRRAAQLYWRQRGRALEAFRWAAHAQRDIISCAFRLLMFARRHGAHRISPALLLKKRAERFSGSAHDALLCAGCLRAKKDGRFGEYVFSPFMRRPPPTPPSLSLSLFSLWLPSFL